MIIHVVKKGDTIFRIAREYGVSPQRIITDNGISSPNYLVVGQALIMLVPEIVYTVKAGDTLAQIATQYDTTVMKLIQNNPSLMTSPDIYVGQQLTIKFKGEKLRDINVNGYAYPNINEQVLLRALPYLTTLTIFGYGFNEDGELIEIVDQPLIDLALEFKVAPIMLLSSITEDGTFSTERASYLFNNIEFQNALIDKILMKMKEKNYYGLDVDFEYVSAEDNEAYSLFLKNITEKLNAEGYTVNVDLPPKTSDTQPGLLYEGVNYSKLGSIADTALLMTYEWGYTYGAPMAVAPINNVEKVVEYAVSEIPVEKILMGIPNYGYDWTLPFEQGISKATSIGNQKALQIADNYYAQIEYDEIAQSPYFNYWDYEGKKHVVWFEDVRSIKEKLDLIKDYNLLGTGYWNLMRPFAQNWALLNAMFDITKVVQ